MFFQCTVSITQTNYCLYSFQVLPTLKMDSDGYATPSTNPDLTDYQLELSHYNKSGSRKRQIQNQVAIPSPSSKITSTESYHSIASKSPDNLTPADVPNKTKQNKIDKLPKQTSLTKNKRKQRIPKANLYKEMKYLQAKTTNIMPKLPFSRLVREILVKYSTVDIRISGTALVALQESSELYLTQFFEDAYRAAVHRDRVTLTVKDMELTRYLRGRSDLCN